VSGGASWRRTRPFWGGLLTLLAGLELLSIPFATKALPLVIQSGTVGATYLIALLLVIVGLLLWLQPGQRIFLGVVAVLVSIASFVYANLGGFLVGMLLGLVGGALAAAWTPIGPASEDTAVPGGDRHRRHASHGGIPQVGMTFTDRRVVGADERLDAMRDQPSASPASGDGPRVFIGRVRAAGEGDRTATGDAPAAGRQEEGAGSAPGDPGSDGFGPDDPGSDDPGPGGGLPGPSPGAPGGDSSEGGGGSSPDARGGDGGPGPAGRALAIAVLPVMLLAGTNSAGAGTGAGGATQPTRAAANVLPVALSATRLAARSGTQAEAQPGARPSEESGTSAGPLPEVLPTAPPTRRPGLLPGLLDGLGESGLGETGLGESGLGEALGVPHAAIPSPPGASRDGEPDGSGGDGESDGSGGSGAGSSAARAATEPAAVRAPSLTMTGMKFHGVVEMPTASGPVKMLHFTMDKAVLEQPTQTMGPATLVGRTFTFEGDVVIYTTKMTGKLLGLPQEFTADNPNVLVRALKLVPSLSVPLTMTDIVSEQPYVTADTLRADDLHLVVGS
jgi:hypothetical protein